MKTNSKKRFSIIVSLLAVTIGLVISPVSVADTLACTQPTKAPKDLGTLVVAGRAENAPAIQWGSEQGCFKKYGLTVKQELVASAAVSNAGMVSGSYDIIVTNPISVVQLMTNGDFGVKIVAPRYGYTAAQIARAKQEPL